MELQNEIRSLNDQLTESKNGLLAASRITDQLESCQVANATLKSECEYQLLVINNLRCNETPIQKIFVLASPQTTHMLHTHTHNK